jgi:hypothetical protein
MLPAMNGDPPETSFIFRQPKRSSTQATVPLGVNHSFSAGYS